jgi:linoleoyl-CoA desaturase
MNAFNTIRPESVKFNKEDQQEFFKVLNKRVNQYFKDTGISRYANSQMVVKTITMVAMYLVPLVLMLTGIVSSFWAVMLMWCIMGLGKTGIGTSVMHDAIHGAYSKNPTVNRNIGYIINLVGGYHTNWKIQHNVLHHSFTNIHDFDEDIDKKVMRFSPTQDKKGIFKLQIIYAPFLYAILTLYWCTVKDFEQLIRYNKRGLYAAQNETFGFALFRIVVLKILYFALFIGLPIVLIDLPWQQVMLGFLVMHFISGMLLALIFQTAHVIEETDFYEVDEKCSVENNWAIHQLKTTANFAKNSKLLAWYIGGLNHQIEHHLFPHICHVHYKSISGIVQKTAEEYKVPYIEHKTFLDAIVSHFKLLHQLGMGKI